MGLNRIKSGQEKFTWGEVIKIHEVGDYSIVEYRRDNGEICFHGYVGKTDTNMSWNTLDQALAGCIAYKYEGPNHRAGNYFITMIGAN